MGLEGPQPRTVSGFRGRGKLVRGKGNNPSWPLSLQLGADVLVKTLPTAQSLFLLHVLPLVSETIR